ncbi:MAG: YciI family protein [Gammaproteobacteria bacterium]
MLYAIISEDIPDSLPKRKVARPDHIARLEEMQAQGRIIIGGPLPAIDDEDPGEAGFTGSLLVAEFESLEDAEAWAQEDPYVKAGVYSGSIVKPFKRVF